MNIGKLVAVPVRDLWEHEQYDFSSWLSKEENIAILGDELVSHLLILRLKNL